MEVYEMQLDQRVINILQKKQAVRITVNVRRSSPLFHTTLTATAPPSTILARVCQTLRIGDDPAACRARLLTVCACPRVTIFNLDAWHDAYDWATAHHRVPDYALPVLVVDYAQWLGGVRLAGLERAREVHEYVAAQHEEAGWHAWPPYRRDMTWPGVPKNPDHHRSAMIVGADGVRRRKVETPPGSTSVSVDGGGECDGHER